MVCNARAFDVLAVYTKESQTACARDFYSIAAGPRIYIFFIGIRSAVLREPSSSTGITAYYSAWEKKNGLYSFASFLWRAHGSNFKNDKYYNVKWSNIHFSKKSLSIAAIISLFFWKYINDYILCFYHFMMTILFIDTIGICDTRIDMLKMISKLSFK